MLTDRLIKANFRFGLLLEFLDTMAEETALAYVAEDLPGTRFVTAAIDEIRIRNAPDIDRDMMLLARVDYVGRTSLEVGIRDQQPGDPSHHVASCYFTMVARSGMGQTATSVALPPYATYPEHENVPRKIFGGYVIHGAFMYASICAESVAADCPTVVAVKRINFHHPVRIAGKLHFTSRVTYAGETSISVETDIVRISRDRSSTALCNTCVFTFANVDAELRRRAVPRIYPATYAEDARYLAGYRRHREHQRYVTPVRTAP